MNKAQFTDSMKNVILGGDMPNHSEIVSFLDFQLQSCLGTLISIPDHLKEYKKTIDSAIENLAKTDAISNSGPDHAAIMMSSFMSNTSKTCHMIVGNFEGSVSNQPVYLQSLNRALNHGIKFRILALEGLNCNSLAVHLLRKAQQNNPEQIKVYVPHGKGVKYIINTNVHWSVFDQKNIRMELTPETFEAIGMTNVGDQAIKLVQKFNEAIKPEYCSEFYLSS